MSLARCLLSHSSELELELLHIAALLWAIKKYASGFNFVDPTRAWLEPDNYQRLGLHVVHYSKASSRLSKDASGSHWP